MHTVFDSKLLSNICSLINKRQLMWSDYLKRIIIEHVCTCTLYSYVTVPNSLPGERLSNRLPSSTRPWKNSIHAWMHPIYLSTRASRLSYRSTNVNSGHSLRSSNRKDGFSNQNHAGFASALEWRALSTAAPVSGAWLRMCCLQLSTKWTTGHRGARRALHRSRSTQHWGHRQRF